MLYAESHGAASKRDSLGVHPLLHPLLPTSSREMKSPSAEDRPPLSSYALPAGFVCPQYAAEIDRREAFATLFHEYAMRFQLRKASMDDFIRLAEEVSGRKLDLFVDQWIRKYEIPRLKIYNVHAAPEGAGWVTKGRVRLVGTRKFSTPCGCGCEDGRSCCGDFGPARHRFRRTSIITTSPSPYRPLGNRNGRWSIPITICFKFQHLPARFSDLRDPSDGTMIVGNSRAELSSPGTGSVRFSGA